MVRFELIVALAVKNWTGRRPGEKVDDSRMLKANDGGRIIWMVIVALLSSPDALLIIVVRLHV